MLSYYVTQGCLGDRTHAEPAVPVLMQGVAVRCVIPGCSGELTYAEGANKYVFLEDQEEIRKQQEVGPSS